MVELQYIYYINIPVTYITTTLEDITVINSPPHLSYFERNVVLKKTVCVVYNLTNCMERMSLKDNLWRGIRQ